MVGRAAVITLLIVIICTAFSSSGTYETLPLAPGESGCGIGEDAEGLIRSVTITRSTIRTPIASEKSATKGA